MKIEGGCYCGALRYEVGGDPIFKGQCHCRECQYISGGSPNVTMAMPDGGFRYTKGKPKAFRRADQPVAHGPEVSHSAASEMASDAGLSDFRTRPSTGRMVATSSATLMPNLRNCERFMIVPFSIRYIQSTTFRTCPPASGVSRML